MTAGPSKAPRASSKSGNHPAVKAYRAKLESVDENVTSATSKLDRELQEFLNVMKTPVPPKPTEAEAEEKEPDPRRPPRPQ